MSPVLKRTLTMAGVANDPFLFGDQSIESGPDYNTAGSAEAFPFTNHTTGTAMSIHVYVDSGNSATTLIAGLYSDKSGHPGSRLASGSLSSPTATAWNTVTVTSTAVSSGGIYWLVVLGRGGTLLFRDRNAGPCTSEGSSQTTLSSLPSSWTSGPQYDTCPISAYVMGTVPTGTPPSNTTLPLLSGTTTQAQTLSTSNGTWTGSPTSYTYQWQDCDSSGANCANNSGATSSGHMLTSSDVGHTMRAVATASNTSGSTAATSAASAVIASSAVAPPSNTAAPAITGTPTQGQALSTSNGSWTGSPTGYTYQWQDCDSSGNGCATITGATSTSYTLAASDVGHTARAVVTATNAGGSVSATSGQTAVVAAGQAAAPTASFTFSPASPTTGQSVHFDGSTSTCGVAPCSYTWADDPPSGGTWPLGSGQSIDFTFAGAATKYVTLTVTDGLNRTGVVEHDVVVTTASVAAPSNSSLPTISGTAQQGQALTTTNGTWTGSPTSYAYQWRQCDSSGNTCTSISGATGSSYTLAASDVGHTARAVVTATNAGGSNSATSAATAVIAASVTGSPSNTALPTISGTATQAQTLTTTNGTWTASPTSYAYQWRQCDSSGNTCTSISGATGSSYTLAASDVGHTARAVVTATNAGGSNSATSAATAVIAAASSGSCDLNATPSSFGSQVSAASAGQTICLASGNYGTWTGTNKAITVRAAAGASPTMNDSFGSGANGFTLDGMTGMSGSISGAAHDITIQNSSFNGEQDVLMDQMQNANIVFNGDTFNNFVGTARLWTQDYNASGGSGATPSGVIVEHSAFTGTTSGGADGVRCDGASVQILDNNFSGINDAPNGGNHGDPIQIYGGTHCIIKGNYFHGMINSATCSLGEWDGGDHNVFENNVVDTGGCYEAVGILADQGSLVDHNTFITPASGCLANPQSQCGSAAVGAKSGQSSSGTVYRDNVMTGFGNGNGGVNASYTENHNLCTSSCGGGSGDIIGAATLAGGSQPTTHDGFLLSGTSLGRSAASDGTNIGIYATGS